MKKIILKINHVLFWWYYNRVSEHFRQWTFFKSVRLLIDNYEHALYREKGLNEVVDKAIKIEEEMKSEISTLRLRAMGVSQEQIDPLNKMLGTELKGISKQERDN